MLPDPAIALPNGLFHFRVVVGVRLREPITIEADEHAAEEEMVGYYRTYRVTAATASGAVRLVEKLGGAHDDDADDPAGTIEEIEVTVLDVAQMELPLGLDELAKEGVHFESGRAFFAGDDDDEDAAVQ